MNESRNLGLLRLRHLAEFTEAKGEQMESESARFRALASPESAPRAVSSFNLFQSPPDIAARMADMAQISGGRVLEPSAGLGRLYRAVRAVSADSDIVLVENSADCCRELWRLVDYDYKSKLVCADFLTCGADRLGGLFDTVVMNPPFKQGRDITHIKWALSLLAPGGRLVSLCYAGPRQRLALEPLADYWEILPSGSFKSEGTGADVALLVINKTK